MCLCCIFQVYILPLFPLLFYDYSQVIKYCLLKKLPNFTDEVVRWCEFADNSNFIEGNKFSVAFYLTGF